ncbi:unnamed protein product [Notodromas monacha]|uniref:F-box domain-containing protein n=1 Tax=Notodromas monacha TaxID=399045 RepID=A0A7R9BSW7_9CRUS|nr:unnamed protein product [Notodromas monacha]CAG0919514.1 unnamed protein product [Notodromas monacha]
MQEIKEPDNHPIGSLNIHWKMSQKNQAWVDKIKVSSGMWPRNFGLTRPRQKLLLAAEESAKLDRLPDEIFVKVFSFLPLRDLLSCKKVSRQWEKNASNPALWRKLNFAVQNRFREDALLAHWIGSNVKQLTVKIDKDLNSYLTLISQTCQNVETLKLFSFWEQIPASQLLEVAENCSHLKCLTIVGCDLSEASLAALAQFPTLVSLTIRKSSHLAPKSADPLLEGLCRQPSPVFDEADLMKSGQQKRGHLIELDIVDHPASSTALLCFQRMNGRKLNKLGCRIARAQEAVTVAKMVDENMDTLYLRYFETPLSAFVNGCKAENLVGLKKLRITCQGLLQVFQGNSAIFINSRLHRRQCGGCVNVVVPMWRLCQRGCANVAAVKVAINENGGITLEDLKATLGIDARTLNCYAVSLVSLLTLLPNLTHFALEADWAPNRRDMDALPDTLQLLFLSGVASVPVDDAVRTLTRLTQLRTVQLTTPPDLTDKLVQVLAQGLTKLRFAKFLSDEHLTQRKRDLLATVAKNKRKSAAEKVILTILPLLQKFSESNAAVQQLLCGGIQVGTELRKSCHFTVLGQLELHTSGNLLHSLCLGSRTDTRHRKTDIDSWSDALVE